MIDDERALGELDYGPNRHYADTEIAFSIEPTSRYPVFRFSMPARYDVLKEPDR
jgi:hypothetical protein